jgi:hypothetical protein
VIKCDRHGKNHLLPLIGSRFENTLDLKIRAQQGHVLQLSPVLETLDQLLSKWEFRSISTPWLIVKSKNLAS